MTVHSACRISPLLCRDRTRIVSCELHDVFYLFLAAACVWWYYKQAVKTWILSSAGRATDS